jgi:hypothetical protein
MQPIKTKKMIQFNIRETPIEIINKEIIRRLNYQINCNTYNRIRSYFRLRFDKELAKRISGQIRNYLYRKKQNVS